MKKSSIVLTCLLLTTACSKVKELDQRTESMEKTTKEMSGTTGDMKETTSTMYLQIRSKEAEDTRDEKFNVLLNKEANSGERITAAGVYFRSMEFQLWNNNDSFDNKDALQAYYLDAANEFTRRIVDLYEKIDLKKMSPTKNNKMDMSFYSLSAAVHMNHHFQEESAKNKKISPTSMYDLIKNALLKDYENKRLLEHEEVLVSGINREIMIELVKARVDMLSALALKNLTDKRDMTLSQKAKGLLFKLTNGSLGSIELPEVYETSNEASKVYIEKYLDGALKAKKFLARIGVKKELEKTLKSAYANIEFNDKTPSSAEKEETPDNKKEVIRGLINDLLN